MLHIIYAHIRATFVAQNAEVLRKQGHGMCEEENMETEHYIWWKVKLAVDTILGSKSVSGTKHQWPNGNISIAVKIHYF
jgi:hypothetical protein